MSYISEKVAYLDGLADGLEIGNDKQGKLLRGIIDTLGAIADQMETQDETIEDLSDCVDDIYDELDEMNEDDFDEDDFIECVCPNCGETVYFDEDMIDSDDGLICPNCNAPIDFDIECCCGDCSEDDGNE